MRKSRWVLKPFYFLRLLTHLVFYFDQWTYLIAFYSLYFALRNRYNLVMTRAVNFSHACTERVNYVYCNVVQHRGILCVIVRIIRQNPFIVTSLSIVPNEYLIWITILSNPVQSMQSLLYYHICILWYRDPRAVKCMWFCLCARNARHMVREIVYRALWDIGCNLVNTASL